MMRLAIALVCIASVVGAQRPQDAAHTATLSSYDRARPILHAAIAAMGGEQRLRAIEDVSIRYRGRRWMAYQSPSLTRPWNVQRTESDLVMDFKNGRMMRRGVSRYPLDFEFAGITVVTPQGNFFYNPTRGGKGDAFTRFRGGPPVATHPARRELPGFILLNALDRAQTLRYVETAVNGARAHAISYAESDGTALTLFVDDASKRLVRTEYLRDDPVVGDQVVALNFSNWRTEKGVQVPGRVVELRNEEMIRDDTLTIALDSRPADSVFAVPASGYAEVADGQAATSPESEAIRKLADNVYLLQQLPGGNRVMFVAFRDHVLVFEAPTPHAAATAVMDAVRRTVPGKPIRYVTFSHHHDDHGAGLRPYIAEGITIVTTPTNRRLVEEVAAAKHSIRPDALSSTTRQPVIETFTRKRVFTDGEMTVELHDIGPTSHVDEIVLAYLPKERLIFQGDLIILPDRGEVDAANTLTAEFLRALERLTLDVTTIAGVHGRVGTIEDLRRAVQLRAQK